MPCGQYVIVPFSFNMPAVPPSGMPAVQHARLLMQ
jgi:hypothetical protein